MSETPRLEEISPGHIKLCGDLTFATVAALQQASQRLLTRASGEITIDLSGIRRADSAGLALLVEWLRLAKKQNKRLTLINLPQQLLTMAKTYDLQRLLPIYHG